MENSADTQITNYETELVFETNQDILKHYFKQRFGEFYIPENAEDEEEYFNYEDFDHQCTSIWQEEQILQEKFPAAEDLVEFAILHIDWQFPCTFVNDLTEMD